MKNDLIPASSDVANDLIPASGMKKIVPGTTAHLTQFLPYQNAACVLASGIYGMRTLILASPSKLSAYAWSVRY